MDEYSLSGFSIFISQVHCDHVSGQEYKNRENFQLFIKSHDLLQIFLSDIQSSSQTHIYIELVFVF